MKAKTRKQRRKTVQALIIQLETILDAEYDYVHDIPVNPQNGERYIEAERTFKVLENALSLLHQAYMPVD